MTRGWIFYGYNAIPYPPAWHWQPIAAAAAAEDDDQPFGSGDPFAEAASRPDPSEADFAPASCDQMLPGGDQVLPGGDQDFAPAS